jgi:hypothetical protein
VDLTDFYRIFHPTAAEFFPETHGTFSKTGHILKHKASLNKYKTIEMTFCILLSHNGIKLEINSERNYRKYTHKDYTIQF